MISCTENIPLVKFNQWYKIFLNHNGRLNGNPSKNYNGESVYVNYSFDDMDDYYEFTQSWKRMTTTIVEVNNTMNRWVRIKRFFKRWLFSL